MPECKNAAVNPRTHRFHNLVEIVNFDEEEDMLFNALLDIEAGNGMASQ